MSAADEILTMNNIQSFTIEYFLELLKEKTTIAVQMSEQEVLVLEVRQTLKSLPILEGYVPSGWKAAIYED